MAYKKNLSVKKHKQTKSHRIREQRESAQGYEEQETDNSETDEEEQHADISQPIKEEEPPKWFNDLPKEPDDHKPSSEADIQQLKEEATIILGNDALHYKNKCLQDRKKSDGEWLHTMLANGTSYDRIAASVILIQNSPIHSLHILRNLISLVKTGKTECAKAMEVLTDLFLSDLLVPDRKLRRFENCPLSVLDTLSGGNGNERKNILKLWYFEDQLKREYTDFVLAIKNVCQSTVESIKYKCMEALRKLLIANPEQEALLLATLTNKFGDPVLKVAVKVINHLHRILTVHPDMKRVIVEEIQKVLFRPNIPKRAQYYAVCTLTQIWLDPEDGDLACLLINMYFSLFKGCIKTGEVECRLMGAILTGVNRAFPYAKRDELKIKDHVEILHKLVHIAPFRVSVQSLCLLFQVCDYDSQISDRFYMALYKKILDPALSSAPQQAIFLSLIFRSLSKDLHYNRVKTFIKRLLQVCHYLPANLACGALIMISHLFKKNESLKCLTLYPTKFEEETEDGEEHYVDVQLESERSRKVVDTPKDKKDTKPVIPSWHHVANLPNTKVRNDVYGRNPLFVHDTPVYTELVSLSTHHHPSVSHFASRLLQGALIDYTGDPLCDFTVTRFLDRWVYRNPKNTVENKEQYSKRFARKRVVLLSDVKSLPPNSGDYLSIPEDRIPVDELFLYRFLKKQEAQGKHFKSKEELEDDYASDVDSVASEEFESMLSQLMGGKEKIAYTDIDYASNISKVDDSDLKKKKKKKGDQESLSSEDDTDVDTDASEESDDADGNDVEEDSDKSEDDDFDYDKIDYDEIDDDDDDLDDDDAKEILEFDSDNEEEFQFTMSDVERDEEESKRKGKKSSLKEGKLSKKKKKHFSGVFAPAEEFAEILENTGEEIATYGNLTNFSTSDNAGMKQVKWEMSRNHWLQGKGQKRKHSGKNKQPVKKGKRKH